MGLSAKKRDDFTLRTKNVQGHGQNIVFIKGGSTVIADKWVFFPDLRIDVKATVQAYVQSVSSRRVFNNVGDVLYVLVALSVTGAIEVIPSISFNKNSYGDVKVFPDIAEKLPLILVKLTQDGSNNLSAMDPISDNDIEIYQGYGNFTLEGPQGDTGPAGVTGINGITGAGGMTGSIGVMGSMGSTGIIGQSVMGVTGAAGTDAVPVPAFILDRSLY